MDERHTSNGAIATTAAHEDIASDGSTAIRSFRWRRLMIRGSVVLAATDLGLCPRLLRLRPLGSGTHSRLGEPWGPAMTQTPMLVPQDENRRHFVQLLTAVIVCGVAVVAFVLLIGRSPTDKTSNVVTGSGIAASESRLVAPFTGIELMGSNNVIVQVGQPQSVVVRADDNLIGRVTTDVRGTQLLIGNAGDYRTKIDMRVEVTVPSLSSVTLSGSGSLAVHGVRTADFTADLPGSGLLTVTGTADVLHATILGSGDEELSGLTSGTVTATVAGSGRISLHATESLNATVRGAGSIVYTGNPATVVKNISGAGAITGG
jgi:hypothetical protein